MLKRMIASIRPGPSARTRLTGTTWSACTNCCLMFGAAPPPCPVPAPPESGEREDLKLHLLCATSLEGYASRGVHFQRFHGLDFPAPNYLVAAALHASARLPTLSS